MDGDPHLYLRPPQDLGALPTRFLLQDIEDKHRSLRRIQPAQRLCDEDAVLRRGLKRVGECIDVIGGKMCAPACDNAPEGSFG